MAAPELFGQEPLDVRLEQLVAVVAEDPLGL
jgi:hypothetical protein